MEGHFKAQNASEERHLRACWFPSIRLNCKLIVSIAAYHYLAVKRLLHLDGHLPLVALFNFLPNSELDKYNCTKIGPAANGQ